MIDDRAIAGVLMDLGLARSPASFCPSEAARRLSDDWRPLMPRLRAVAATLPLMATQKGVAVDPVAARGPIRLTLNRGASCDG